MKVTIALIGFICVIAAGVIIFCLNLPFGRMIYSPAVKSLSLNANNN